MAEARVTNLLDYFKGRLEPVGFEVYPFLVGWYNDLVTELHDASFQLDYPKDTLAFVVLSTPSMFEKVFIPFLKSLPDAEFEKLLAEYPDDSENPHANPVNTAIHQKLEEARIDCTLIEDNETIDLLHDYDKKPAPNDEHSSQYKVLVQYAVDVAGAVRLYKSRDLDVSQLFETPFEKVCSCALHPRYGGWFIIRGVYVFKNLTHPALERPPTPEILESKNEIQDFLKKANLHGKEMSLGWRDFGKPVERYSEIQQRYFSTFPTKDRRPLLPDLRNL